MSIPDVVWDGTGKHAARIVLHLRRDGFAASFAPRRREIHVIGPSGALHRIHPTPHAAPDCRTCDRGSVDCCDPWESPHDPSSYAYEHTKETTDEH